MTQIPISAAKPREYRQVFNVTIVECSNCQQGAAANQKMVAETLDAIPVVGAQMHATVVTQNKIICANPLLMITYVPIMIDVELLNRAANPASVIPANGAH